VCGISGTFSVKEKSEGYDFTLVKNILSAQNHRGPDFQDTTSIKTNNAQLSFGHNRLKIIDLSPKAN